MTQKFSILNKKEDDVTNSDLKELPKILTIFFSEVKKENNISSNVYQALDIPTLPQENLFVSLFQQYLGIDLNDFEALASEDIAHLIQLLNGILTSNIAMNRYEKLENLTQEVMDQITQAYFCAESHVFRSRKKQF